MSSYNFVELSVNLLFNGVSCKTPNVEFEKPSGCIDVRCEYSDGRILVQFPDGCNDCVYAIVSCSDDMCEFCESSKRIKICPCSKSSDCEDCEECINGLCTSICPEDKECDSGRCVDCLDNTQCLNNQICVDGKCLCPPDKPYLNSKDECVACDDLHPCPNCTTCKDGMCVEFDCQVGVCNPDTGDCVECVNSGDCTKKNECCVNNSCECCDGFERDYKTGECVPVDDCKFDTDCKECEICYLGKCVPKECPDGYICKDGKCKKICDCDKRDCPSKDDTCISDDGGDCYCNECSGNCSSSDDCGVGCFCSGGICIPNPCNGPCVDGSDCGEGCGCNKDGMCVPCESIVCDKCSDVLGCKCSDGKNCKDVGGCDGPCNSHNDCSDNCTCKEGMCVPCADFDCDNDCNQMPGCECVGTSCEGSDDGCNDVFDITKDDLNCDLVATLTKEFPCSCEQITVIAGVQEMGEAWHGSNGEEWAETSAIFYVDLRKGVASSVATAKMLPRLDDLSSPNIAENELPLSGVFSISVKTTYKEYDEFDRFVGFTTSPVTTNSVSVQGKTKTGVPSDHTYTLIPYVGYREGNTEVYKVEISISLTSDLVFENGCTYKAQKLIKKYTLIGADNFINKATNDTVSWKGHDAIKALSSSDERDPMFIWYRSEDGSFSPSEIIRKLYIPKIGGKYQDTLYGPAESPVGKYPLVTPEGELWSNRHYLVMNDCSCDKDGDFGKVVFCNPEPLFHEFTECGMKVRLLEPFTPCDVNQDLNQWRNSDYDIPQDVQVKYLFYINGKLVKTFVHDDTFGMVQDDTGNTMFGEYGIGEPISEIKLVINHDDKHECDLVYPGIVEEPPKVDKEILCDSVGDTFRIVIKNSTSAYALTNVTTSGANAVVSLLINGDYEIVANKGENLTINYTFDTGCVYSETVNEDCCDDFTIGVTASDITCGSSDLTISYNIVSGGATVVSSVLTRPDGTTLDMPGGSVTIPVGQYTGGLYTVTVTDKNGCVATGSINVSFTPDVNITITETNGTEICNGDTTTINVLVAPEGYGGSLNYSANGVATTEVVPATGLIEIGPIATDATYVFTSLVHDGCTQNINETVSITVLPTTTVSITEVSDTVCSGSDVTFNLSGGQSGQKIKVSMNGTDVGTVTLDGSGAGTFVYQPVATSTFTFTQDPTDVDRPCSAGLPYSKVINVLPGSSITLDSTSCDATLTFKTLTFNHITSAEDQDGNALTVNGGVSVTVNVNTVSHVTVFYNDGTCTSQLTVPVGGCDCPTVTIDMNDVTINIGESATLNPVVTGSNGPYTYLWSTGETTQSITVSPTTTTTYTVTVTSTVDNCSYTKNVTVVVVNCTGSYSIGYDSCSCDGGACQMFYPITLNGDYTNCGEATATGDIKAYIDGSAVAIDVATLIYNGFITFVLPPPNTGACPNFNSVQFVGDLTLAPGVGTGACCNGVVLHINDTFNKPGGGWNCQNC